MTDLAARLRDLLSDHELMRLRNACARADSREHVVAVLLPLLSSLQEERELEIREVIEGEVASLKATYRQDDLYTVGARDALDLVLSRLASSSSPAAQEQK